MKTLLENESLYEIAYAESNDVIIIFTERENIN